MIRRKSTRFYFALVGAADLYAKEVSMHVFQLLFSLIFLLTISGHLEAAMDAGSTETKIKTIVIDPNSQSPVVILETVNDKKLIPIWIGVAEAQAIALELKSVSLPRPLTHDLLRNILDKLGAKLRRVTVTEIRDNTYFALLSLEFNGHAIQIDSRPSDAIALAIRMKAPIYASPQILANARAMPAEDDRADESLKSLGLQGQELTKELAALMELPSKRGVLVADVALGGRAMNAGIERGDIITKANGRAVGTTADLVTVLESAKSPAQLKLEVLKKGKPTIITIDLAK